MRRAGAVALLFLVWTTAAHAAPVKVYVSAGGPVVGAAITVDGKAAAHRSDARGFAIVDVPQSAGLVRIAAAGGHVSWLPVRGSLRATVQLPIDRRTVYVNPVSTVVAAYHAARPGTSLRIAEERVRQLFGLSAHDDIGHGLRQRPRYFDGRRFVLYADEHGGVDAYARRLAARIDRRHGSVTFRRLDPIPELDQGSDIGSIAQTLRTTGSVFGILSGSFTIVNDIINWTKAPQASNNTILAAVNSLGTQLSTIDETLSTINSELQTDFANLQTFNDCNSFTTATAKVATLTQYVATAELDYEDLTSNASSSSFDAGTASTDSSDMQTQMSKIEPKFLTASLTPGVFVGALAQSSASAYSLLAKCLADENGGFLTAGSSAELDEYEAYVLYYQALAFQLIMVWEAAGHQGVKVTSVPKMEQYLTQYLGNDADWQAWVTANPPGTTPSAPPASGDLDTEVTYLQTIQDVPDATVVDPKGTMFWTSARGPQTAGLFESDLQMNTYLADNVGCDAYYDASIDPGSYAQSPFGDQSVPVCYNLWQAFTQIGTDTASLLGGISKATKLDGWAWAGTSQLVELNGYPSGASLITAPDGGAWTDYSYWDGNLWCVDDAVEKPNCNSDGDYFIDGLYFDYYGRSCEWNTASDCYNGDYLSYPEYSIVDVLQLPVTDENALASGSPSLFCYLGANGETQQGCGPLAMLPYRKTTSSEKYTP